MSVLWASRKFRTLVLDAFFSSLVTLLTLWLSPESLKVVMVMVVTWQPVVYVVIRGITEEDVAALNAGTHPSQLALPDLEDSKYQEIEG